MPIAHCFSIGNATQFHTYFIQLNSNPPFFPFGLCFLVSIQNLSTNTLLTSANYASKAL